VKNEIKTEPVNRLFKIFNVNRTKNGEFIQFTLLELEIDRYMEWIDIAVTNLNNMDMFLEYD